MKKVQEICKSVVVGLFFTVLLSGHAVAAEELLAERSISVNELSVNKPLMESEAKAWEVNFFTRVLSEYLGSSGFNLSNGKAVSQNDLSVTYKSITAEIWTSTVFGEDWRDSDGDEVDFTLTWNGKLPGSWMEKVDWSIGLAYFDCPKLFSGTAGDVIEPFFEAKHEIKLSESAAIFPYVRGEFNFSVDGGTNTNIHLGVGHSWQIAPSLKWNNKVAAVFDGGGENVDSGVIAMLQSSLNYTINKTFNVDILMLKATDPISGAEDRGSKESIGAGLNMRF